jgi:hypothetical protein
MSDSVKTSLLVRNMVKSNPAADSTPTNATAIQTRLRLDMACSASGYDSVAHLLRR